MVLPPLSDIKFTNDWTDDSKDYVISVMHTGTQIELASTKPMFDHRSIFEVHLFIRKISEDEPEEVGDIEKEVERILIENPTILLNTEGVSLVHILDFRKVEDQDSGNTRWHYVFDVEMIYRKFVVS